MSSRICVKNLPKYATEQSVREHFTKAGDVTDVKVLRTKGGRGVARGMAFIGFRTEEQAKQAIKYFHRTFMDTARLKVEEAFPVGDKRIQRPWSKHSRGSSA